MSMERTRGRGVSAARPRSLAVPLLAVACALGASSCRREAVGSEGDPRVLWHVDGRGWIEPLVDGSTVYFGSATHDLVALDRESGAVRWTARAAGLQGDTDGRNIVLAGDVVVMGDQQMHAFARATGAARWTFAPADGARSGVYRLASDGQTIYAGSPEGRVYAVDAATGAQRWATAVASDGITAVYDPVVAGGLVIVGYRRFATPVTGGAVALDAATGAERWRVAFDPPVSGQYSGCGGGVAVGELFVTTTEDGRVHALDRATGAARWTAARVHALPTESATGLWNDVRPLAATADLIVVGSSTGTVVALDPATGTERWRNADRNASTVFRPTIGAQEVYVDHQLGELAALDRATGALRWRAGGYQQGVDSFFGSAVPDGDRVFVNGFRGFYALRGR